MSNDRFEEANQSHESRIDSGSSRINAVELQAGREKISIDPQLHEGYAGAIETHLNAISRIDTPHTQDTVDAAKKYTEYKSGLVNACFDGNGNIRSEASDRDLLKLYDLNKAEVVATTSRISSVKERGKDVITQAQYEDPKAAVPTSIG